ncbi:hypothetical protein, partial [Nostoc punctiforme]|uniref:hypothetical protein n=1 Tax=Nostoc punctiforme TaxID=272131 RepID=UPI001A7E24DF
LVRAIFFWLGHNHYDLSLLAFAFALYLKALYLYDLSPSTYPNFLSFILHYFSLDTPLEYGITTGCDFCGHFTSIQ